jgi:hypothetical protein
VLRVGCCNWLWKPKLKDLDKPKSGMGEVVGLQTALLAAVGALLVYAYQREVTPSLSGLLAYIGVSLVPLALLFWILCLRSSATDKTSAFDRSTIMFARGSFGLSAIMVLVVAVSFWEGWLPQQPSVRSYLMRLPVDRIDDFRYQVPQYANRPGLVAYVLINKNVFPSGVPQDMQLRVALDAQAAREWQLTGTYGIDGRSVSQKHPTTYMGRTDQPTVQRVTIEDLDQNGEYALVIYLVGTGKARAQDEKTRDRLAKAGIAVSMKVELP